MRGEEEVRRAMEAYGDMVWRVCMVHLKNAADTEDILQEVFLKFALHSQPFESPQHEKAWVLRGVFQGKTASLDEVMDCQAEPVPQEHRDLLAAVLELPAKYKDVVYLHYFEGYTAGEIGKLLHKNTNTVYTWLERARKLLKTQLEGGDCHG